MGSRYVLDKGAGRREVSWEPVEQQDSKGKSQGDCVPLYNRKREKALKMQDETGIISLKINLLVRAAYSICVLPLSPIL